MSLASSQDKKANIQKLLVFTYTSNESLEIEKKKSVTIPSKYEVFRNKLNKICSKTIKLSNTAGKFYKTFTG